MKGSMIGKRLWTGLLGLLLLAATAQSFAQVPRGDRRVREDLQRLQEQLSTFRYDLQDVLRRIRYREYRGEDPNIAMEDLDEAYRAFNDDFRAKREDGTGLSELLREAKDVDDFVKFVDLGDKVNYGWSRVRSVLDSLASAYEVSWNWGDDGSNNSAGGSNNAGSNNDNDNGDDDNYSYSQPLPNQTPEPYAIPRQTGGENYYAQGLSGTYRLNAAESDNAREVADRAMIIMNQRDKDRIGRELEDKLTAPEDLTLDVRGQQVTISSSRGTQGTFMADGTDKYETLADGKSVRVRATLRGSDKLTITSVGDRDNDYTVNFESIDGGRRLRVTRRVNFDSMSQTVLAESIYDKNSGGAQTGGNYPGNNYPGNMGGNYPSTTTVTRSGQFIVPNGTVLSATMENEISTKVSQNNDRFRMTVQSPNEFRGAVIEGYVSNVKRSGKLNSRATITFNFERIRMRNGQTYEFAGFLQSITNANGEIVKVDTEGVATGDSQTKETVKRGGIGAGIGAVIGGVLGGVKGAVIGATIGAAGGAGSVYVQGRDDLELKQGSTVGIQASAPRDTGYRP